MNSYDETKLGWMHTIEYEGEVDGETSICIAGERSVNVPVEKSDGR